MATRKIKNRQRGANIERLTDQQKTFVLELLGTSEFNPTEAARRAKYKNPSQAAANLMAKPAIAAILGKAKREREERLELKADDVYGYLRNVLFFNPLEYFVPGEDGQWTLSDPSTLPDWVGRMIESIEIDHRSNEDGERSTFKVKLVSKTTALGYALKHVSPPEEKNVNVRLLDWSKLHERPSEDEFDEVEAEIKRIVQGDDS